MTPGPVGHKKNVRIVKKLVVRSKNDPKMQICANKAFHKKLQYPFERNSFIVTTSLLRFTSMLPRVAYFPSILTKFHNFLQEVL